MGRRDETSDGTSLRLFCLATLSPLCGAICLLQLPGPAEQSFLPERIGDLLIQALLPLPLRELIIFLNKSCLLAH